MPLSLRSELSQLKLNVKVGQDDTDERMTIELPCGKVVTIARSPLAKINNRVSFDVWFPPSKKGMGADVAPGKSAREVIDLVTRYVAESVKA